MDADARPSFRLCGSRLFCAADLLFATGLQFMLRFTERINSFRCLTSTDLQWTSKYWPYILLQKIVPAVIHVQFSREVG